MKNKCEKCNKVIKEPVRGLEGSQFDKFYFNKYGLCYDCYLNTVQPEVKK